jgi:hypothetical protein
MVQQHHHENLSRQFLGTIVALQSDLAHLTFRWPKALHPNYNLTEKLRGAGVTSKHMNYMTICAHTSDMSDVLEGI